MVFPQNGLDYDDEKLRGMADRARERAMQGAEEAELPTAVRRQNRLKKLGLSILAVAVVALLIVALALLRRAN